MPWTALWRAETGGGEGSSGCSDWEGVGGGVSGLGGHRFSSHRPGEGRAERLGRPTEGKGRPPPPFLGLLALAGWNCRNMPRARVLGQSSAPRQPRAVAVPGWLAAPHRLSLPVVAYMRRPQHSWRRLAGRGFCGWGRRGGAGRGRSCLGSQEMPAESKFTLGFIFHSISAWSFQEPWGGEPPRTEKCSLLCLLGRRSCTQRCSLPKAK